MEQLTKKERFIMDILWNSNEALAASEINEQSQDLNINTVQQVLRRLLNDRFIEVSEIGFNKKALMRKYKPIITQAQYINSFINERSRFELLCGLVDQENDIDSLNELEKLIQQRKNELQ